MFVSVINHLLLAIDLIMFFSIKIKTLPNWDLNSGTSYYKAPALPSYFMPFVYL